MDAISYSLDEKQAIRGGDMVMLDQVPLGSLGGAPAPGRDASPDDGGCLNFRVAVHRPQGTRLGLELDLTDGMTACVVQVAAGVVQEFNERAGDGPRLRPCDCIVAVNGSGGNAESILRSLQEEEDLCIEVRRPRTLKVSIPAAEGSLGVRVIYGITGSSLFVNGILPGRVEAFNRSNTSRRDNGEVRAKDRIFCVNGVHGERDGPRALLDALKDPGQKDLVVLRLD